MLRTKKRFFLLFVIVGLIATLASCASSNKYVKITLDSDYYEIYKGQTIELVPVVNKGSSVGEVVIEYSSYDDTIATYTDGKLHGVEYGETIVKVVYADNVTICDVAKVKVVEHDLESNVSVETKEITLFESNSQNIVYGAYAEGVYSFESSNPEVAVVDSMGLVTATDTGAQHNDGKATITVTASDVYGVVEDVVFTVEVTVVEAHYAITLDANGGEVADGGEYDVNNLPHALPTPTRAGYTFLGWKLNGEGELVTEVAEGTLGAVKYVAQWKANPYTITYDYDGGALAAGQSNPGGYDAYENVVLAEPTKVGHTFAGWLFNGAAGQFPAYGDVEVKATWTANVYDISYDYAGGELAAGKVNPATYTYGVGATFLEPTKVGHTFLGWYAGNVKVTGVEADQTGDVEVVAKWEVNKYTITYHDKNATSNDNAHEYTYGKGYELLDPAKAGYTFGGWYTDEACTKAAADISTTDTGDKVFYAKWDIITYTVTFDAKGGKEVPAYKYTILSETKALEATTKVGYTFKGWFDGTKVVTEITSGNYGDVTLVAQWEANVYWLRFVENGAADIASHEFTIETGPYDLTKAPYVPELEGHTFKGWYRNDTDTEAVELIDCVYEITNENYDAGGNLTLFARWEVNKYTITFDVQGGTEVAPITQNYATAVTAPANPTKVGHTFAGWDVAVPATMPAKDLVITAKWTPNVYNIAYEDDHATANVNKKQYTYGVGLELVPAEKAGYSFLGWYADSKFETPEVTAISATELGDKVLYAKWQINTYSVVFDAAGGKDVDAKTYNILSETFALPTTTKVGHTFLGWYDVHGAKWEEVKSGSYQNLVLTAKWQVNSYSITLVKTDLDTDTIVMPYGSTLPTFVNPSKVGYTFDGWDKEIPATMPAENLVITAKWTINKYTIVFDVQGGTEIAPIKQDYATAITAPADPTKVGHTFLGWDKAVPATMPAEDLVITAKWEANVYNVTYEDDHATANDNKAQYTYGKGLQLVAAEKAGYKFEGWYDNAGFSGAAVTEIAANATGDKVLYAKFTINTYTVVFEANGGMAVAAKTYNILSETFALPSTTKEGHTFLGWYDVHDVKWEEVKSGTYQNLVLTAKWQVNSYSITLVKTDLDTDTIVMPYGSTLPTFVNPSKVGYTFDGWDKEIPATMPAENLVITAKWDANTYAITFDTDGGSAIASIVQDCDTAVVAPANPTKEGYTFKGWDKEIPATMPAENVTITAKWEINKYTITFDTVGGSAVAPITLDYGKAVVAPAAPVKEGYTFINWLDLPATMPAKDVTIKAYWQINQYTITFDADGGSAVAPITLDYGKDVVAPAKPVKEGYTFIDWDITLPATMPAKDLEAKAIWEINQYTITFDTNGGSAVAPITQNYGTAVVMPAAPTKEGHSFVMWSATPATMPAENITIKAYWNVNKYTIEFNTDGGSAVATIEQDYGTAIVAPAKPVKEGYTFVSWDITLPATMPAEKLKAKAIWQINQYTITFDTNGGSAIAPITQDYGTAITAPANPTKDYYEFVAWDKVIPSTMPACNLTIKAHWSPVVYTITYVNVPVTATNTNPTTYTVESAAITLADLTVEHFTFLGWYADAALTQKFAGIAAGSNGNVTVYASLTATQYEIVYNLGSEDAFFEVEPDKDYQNDESVVLAKPVRPGYEFTGWVDELGNPVTEIKVGSYGTQKVTATWKLRDYTIEFIVDPVEGLPTTTIGAMYKIDGLVAPAIITYQITSDAIHLDVLTAAGYDFAGWAYEDQGRLIKLENNTFFPASQHGNHKLYALWNVK